MSNSNMQICPRCHATIQPIMVHGHGQCPVCKSNIMDCCQGETCQPRTASTEGIKNERPPTSP